MRVAVLVLVAAGFASADDKKPKYTHTSNEEGFAVGLPGKPKTETIKLTTVAGELPVRKTWYDSGSDLVLSVTTTTYPKEFVGLRPETVFDGMKTEIAGADGKVTEDKAVSIGPDNTPGRQWRIEAGKSVVRVRVYLRGTRLYQVMANGTKDGVAGAAAEELFRTFEILK